MSPNGSLHVLQIQASSLDAARIRRSLIGAHPDASLSTVTSLQAGINALASVEFDVCLLDLELSGVPSLDAVRAIRDHDSGVPIVVLTDGDNETLALDALNEGAQDYILKSSPMESSLARIIRHSIRRNEYRRRNDELLQDLQQHRGLLVRKNRRLRQLIRTAHDFVDNVSHEFRTPLTVIKEYASLIREGVVGPINDDQERFLTIVEDRSDDLNIMIDDMLDSSRLKTGLLVSHRRPCTVGEVIGHVRSTLERKAAARGCRLRIDQSEELPTIFCDPEKAHRVLTNLVVNAIKFSPENAEVVVAASDRPDEQEVVLTVTDSGTGIAEEDQQRIFERFRQVGADTRSSTKGFGIGLAIARELMELNFGRISVESQLGKGSRFSITFPYADAEEITRRFVRRLLSASPEFGHSTVSVVEFTLPESVSDELAEDTESFLFYLQRSDDLVIPLGKRVWAVLLPVDSRGAQAFLDRVEECRTQANRNRPQGSLPGLAGRLLGVFSLRDEKDQIVTCVSDNHPSQELHICHV